MMGTRAAFRQMLREPGEIVIPEATIPGIARLVETMGFPAIYCGGYSTSALGFAIPDHGLVTTSELADSARRIVDVVNIPVICDADQGGETVLNVSRTTRLFERAGVAAIHIEDSRNPKHMYRDDALVSKQELVDRVKAALDARTDPDFVVIARTDVMFNQGEVDEVIERGIACREAGADMYFVCLLPGEHIDRVAREVGLPIMDIGHPGASPETQAGLKLKVWAGLLIRGIVMGAHAMLTQLQREGKMDLVGGETYGFAGRGAEGIMDKVLREKEYHEHIDRLSNPGKRG